MEEVLKVNAFYIVLVGSIAMFLLVGGVIFFIILYQKKFIENIQEKQKLKTEHQKELLHSYIVAQEKERKRIAADLHDGIGASLAAIKMMLNQLKLKRKDNQNLIDECKEAIQLTTASARQISHNLMPPSLETVGLIKTVERLAKSVTNESLLVSVSVSENFKINKEIELPLYRITQELINNTLKHAQANKIDIIFDRSDDKNIFSYSDDGKGFKKTTDPGLGLNNIESRVQMIGGRLQHFSTPYKSTGVKIEL